MLGRQFPRDRIAALLDGESIDLDAELAALERSGVIHRKGGIGVDEFRFGESLTQQVAYEGLLNRERRRLHDRVALLLLSTEAELDATRIARIGHHLSRGEDATRGVRTLLEAAENAMAIPVYGVAVRLYREAWSLAEAALDEGDRAADADLERWALRAACGLLHTVVVYSSGDVSAEEAVAARGIELAEKLGDKSALARLYADRGFVMASAERERFAEGLGMIQRAVAIAEESGLPDERVRLWRDLCWAYLLDGRLEDATRQIDATLAELDRLGQSTARTDVYMGARFFRARVLYESDRVREAESYSRETHRLALEAHNSTVQSAVSSMVASTLVLQGRYAESVEWSDRALEVARRIESLPAVRSAMASRLIARVAGGNTSVGSEELEALAGGLLTAGDMGLTVDQIIAALLDVGEVERAHAVSETWKSRAGGRLREARIALTRGEIALARGLIGCMARAEGDLRDAIELGSAIGLRSIVGRAQLGLARIALARGQTKKGVKYAREAADLFAALELGHHARRALALLAEPDEVRHGRSGELGVAS